MQLKKNRLFCFVTIVTFLFSFSLFSQSTQEPLVVKLETENTLSPLYLLPLTQDHSSFQESYLQQLESILAFDLDHNGTTFVAKRTTANNQLGQSGSFNQFGAIGAWREKHIFYVIKGQIQDKKLNLLILNTQNQSVKSIDGIALTGDLSEDRKQIHRLADAIHKMLFKTDGIASTRILFTIKTATSSDSSKWTSEVWESDYDGANLRQLTKDSSTCVTPIYLPPKAGYATGGFLYVSYLYGQSKIMIASFKDDKKQRLTTIRGNQLMPAISKQRDRVAFICDITGNPDLFMQPFSPEKGAIGKPQQIFSAKSSTQGSPTFSPDGSRIAFVSNKDGSPKIYVMEIPLPGTNINNIKPVLITKLNRENSAPAWSPDGKKLAYCAKGGGERQIWVYDFDNRQERQITSGKGNKENPSWAPNSLHLIYNTSDPKSSNLFITNLNQGDATQITFGPGEKQFPCWEPRF